MEKNLNFISLRHVKKTYSEEPVLKDITVNFPTGEFTAIVGKSGSGKSTLLNMVSGIDRPTSGEILCGENQLHEMNEAKLTAWRGKNVGIVFQFFQLIPTLTVLENILLPMDFCAIVPNSKRTQTAKKLLEKMGVSRYADTLPTLLSGGEQQRVAIARSLANNPPLIIADEPTGNLDSQNAEEIIRLFREMADEGKTIIIVTHSRELSECADRIVSIHDGNIEGDTSKAVG